MSSYPLMVNSRQIKRSVVSAMSLLLISAAAAYGQSFTLTPSQLHPASVNPGSSATATIELMPVPSTAFNNVVDLTCAVASNQTSTPPQCQVSPTSATPGATGDQISLTITTSNTTPAGTYQITVTGTSGSLAPVTATLFLNVTDLTEDYTISALPTTAVPSPVSAGNTATTTVTVAPLGSYTGTVTLSCLSVTPLVTGAPVCSFNPASVNVTGGALPTTTLTITTFGTSGVPTSTSSNRPGQRAFYALWLALPALAIGLGTTRNRGRRLMGTFMLLAIAGGLILMPACGSSPTNKAVNQITPTDTYTFTLSGADEHGAGPSSATPATVTLQVTPQT